ncbi:MAG: ABC transporter substrate-binding protein, partial [Actinomycetota bacterium]
MATRSGAALLLLTLLAGACTRSGSDPQAGPQATASARPEETEAPPEQDGEPRPPGPDLPRGGGEDPFTPEDEVLTVAIKEPRTLDPMRIADPGSVLIARQLYEGLTRWDPDERKVVPGAAASWKVKDEGRRFVFRLRNDLTFHDGTPITSKDFQYAFDRIARKKNASDLAFTLEPVKGFAAVNQFGKSGELSGIRTPNARTLVIELRRSLTEFAAVLTHPALVPLPRRAVRRYDRFLSRPMGNGSFRMARPWTGTGP